MKAIGAALFRSLLEAVDSKRALTAFAGALSASLVLLAGKQGWTWLDQDTANKIALVVAVKGVALIASFTARDAGPAPATPTVPTTT